ncbi:MAG TPA: PIN domain-containing protein [Woeseiaceae bacterium]|nr:PIN domain-containing protein [Woeseiaceae bacterium]
MGNHYVLIDYEHVQPDGLAPLHSRPVRVYLFVGDPEASLPFDLVSSVQAFGDRATYVPVTDDGRRALELHVACYLGRLAERDPQGHLHIVSPDDGFDAFIAQLRAEGVSVRRARSLAELPFLGAAAASSREDRVAEVIRNLHSRGLARPRRRRTLMRLIHAHFGRELDFAEVQALVDALVEQGCVRFEGETVHYARPITRR